MRKSVTAILVAVIALCNAFSYGPALAARPAAPVTAEALLQMMPDSDGFIAVDIARIGGQLQSLMTQRADLAAKFRKGLDRMAAITGINPAAAAQVVLGFSLADDPRQSRTVALLSGAFNQDEILAQLAQSSGKAWKAKTYKGQRIYVDPAKQKPKKERATIAFFDNQTVIAFGSNQDVKKVVAVRTGTLAGVTQNAALMSAFQQTDASASILFAFIVPEAVRQWLANAEGGLLRPLAAVTQVSGTIDLTESGLTALIALLTGSPGEATGVVNLLNTGLTLLKLALAGKPGAELLLEVLNGISVAPAGNVANITVNISADLIRRLIEAYGARVPRP